MVNPHMAAVPLGHDNSSANSIRSSIAAPLSDVSLLGMRFTFKPTAVIYVRNSQPA